MSFPAYAALAERLACTSHAPARLALLGHWCASQPDPERGLGLGLLTGALRLGGATPALLRAMAKPRVDPVLLRLSHGFVGDFAETLALLWPATERVNTAAPSLAELVAAPRPAIPELLPGWLDRLEASARVVLLKLLGAGRQAAVAPAEAQQALAAWAGLSPVQLAAAWHAVVPPYLALFAWAEGRAPCPEALDSAVFRPMALPLAKASLARLVPQHWRCTWQGEGERVQLAAGPAGRRVFSEAGADISAAHPALLAALDFHVVLEAELPPQAGAALRLHDLLLDGTEDVREQPFDARRTRLEAWFARQQPAGMALAPLLPCASQAELAALQARARAAGARALLLKRGDSPYHAPCWRWPRAPLLLDAVLLYAERSSTGAAYSFGLWRPDGGGGEVLVPVGKAAFTGSAAEAAWLEQWVRENTAQRFGPVREVAPALVLEVAYDAARLSPRHKAGLRLQEARILRLRRGTPAADAGRLASLPG